MRGLRGLRGLEKLRGSWVVGRGMLATLRGSWVNLRGSWVLFTDNFALVILRGSNFLRGYVSGTFCVGCPFCVSLIAA